MNEIPEIINNFNVYKDGNQLIGVAGEITLPDFEAVTESISGAGILGEFEAINPGQFGAQEFEIPFRLCYGDIYQLLGNQPVTLTLRGAMQIANGSGETDFKGIRVIVQGAAKKFTGGTVSAGKPTSSSVTLALTYIKVEVDGKTEIELDKLNSRYVVNDNDVLTPIRELI